MDKLVSLSRGRSALYRSFVFSLAALLVGAVIVGFTARAANYTALFPGAANWTATTSAGASAVWGCGTVGVGDTCGIYPGQIVGNPFVDNANMNLGSALSLAVTTSIAAPFRLNMNGFGQSVDVQNGGTISLSGASAVTSTGGTNTLSVSGGTLNLGAGGTLGINGINPGAQFTFNGGSLAGSGTLTVSQQGIMNVTGTQGAMTSGNLLNITNNSTLNYNATTNGWTLNGPLLTTGTFNDTGSAPITGGGSISNTGVFQKGSGAQSIVNVPFNDSGTVSITSTSGASSIDFSRGGNLSGPFNFGVLPGSSFLFAGNSGSPMNFNAGVSFSGPGDVTFHGSQQNVNTTLNLPGNFTNSGNTFFGGATQQTINVAGNFTQATAPTGSIDARLFSGTTFDKVAVTGTAGLSGTFNESVLYSPANGDTFQPVTFSNNGGTTFQTVNAINPNGVFLVSYPPSTAAATALQLLAAPSVDVSVLKVGQGSVLHNGTVSYTVKVGNAPGPSAATNVVIHDTFNSGTFNPASSDPSCTLVSPGNVSCGPIASIAPNTSVNIIVAIDATSLTTITNTASLASVSEVDTNSGNDSSTATTTVTPVADLSLTKTGPATVAAGAPVSYTVTMTNGGPDSPTTATVTDNLPAGLTAVTAVGTGWTCTLASTTVTCNVTSPPVGAAPPITISGIAPAAGGPITNSATVSEAGATDSNNTNNSASVTTTVTASADIGITKTGPATIVAGQSITYNYAVTNNGPSNVVNVTVNDTPSAGLTPVSSTAPCASFPCTIATLNAGSTVNFTATFAVSATATGSVSNTATASASGVTDPNSLNDSSTAVTAITVDSDVQISKTGPLTASPGQTITYTINLINNGPSTATGITVTDPTPAGTTAGPVTGSCAAFPCNIASLAPGAGASINATYTINAATTSVTNAASVTSTSPDSNGGNNTSSITTTVTPKADLSITKTGPATLPASGPITFIIVVKNNGPSTANNVSINDSPGPGLGFISNSGGCSTPFPCSTPSLASGGQIIIQSKYNVSGGVSSVTNTADVNSATPDPNNANNSATVTVSTGNTCPSGTLSQFQPFSGQQDAPTSGVIQWTNVGASSYEVYMGPAGTGTACSTLVATVNGTSYNYTGLAGNTDYESRIIAVQPGCPSIASQCIRWRTVSGGCNLSAPVLQTPAAGTTVGTTTTLKWSAVSGATSYHVVVIVNGVTQVDTTTPDTSLDVTIPNGQATWSVTAISGNCTSPSATGTFGICGPPPAPVVGVVGAPTSGNAYSVIAVVPSQGAVSYDFQESQDASFGSVITQNTNSTSLQYVHITNVPQVFFYRVRAIGACTNNAGPFSKTVRVVIVPAVQDLRNPKVNVPSGNKDLVVVQVFIPGDSTNENFVATADRPWIVRIDPSSGILPPQGITLNVTIDPAQLPNGTFTATIIVNTSPISGSSRLVTNGSNKSVPVSINLVTPVVPVNPNAPTADSIFIPVVGHLAGLNSQWRSDIRIYNASPQTLNYLLNFTPQGSTDVKQTTITTLSGDTTALDDIIHNWFGVGEVGDSSTGSLEIRPMTTDGSTTPPKGSAFTTVASSRTFDATSDGTVGQFIPPVAFSNFIGNGSRLSLQQLAQTQAYRTNFGLLEGSGSPVSLVLSMFNSAGTKLFDLPVNLAAGEQKLLNGLLAEKGVTVNDGRMEVAVASGSGKVTAYASVIDNASLDPQLVPGQNLTNTTSKLYVVPGVADLNNGVASWRTDMRVYNSGSTPQSTDLAFYPQDNALPFFATISVNPNEVKVLDSVVQSLFGTHDAGGMVQLTTPTDSQLVVTARTYNQTANGTLGQFIKAATAAEGITTNTKALNILQVEDSPRFRTNVGLAEMTGKPVTVEVSVILPDSKVTPSIQVPMAANEFRQFGVAQFGLGNIYNARVSVKVIDGTGSVTAYGSVIDQVTTDPTYVQAQ